MNEEPKSLRVRYPLSLVRVITFAFHCENITCPVLRNHIKLVYKNKLMDTEILSSKKDIEAIDVEQIEKFVRSNYWRIRECDHYKEEYSECRSLKAKFHQYFINGEVSNCNDWRDAASNCRKCEKNDYRACAELIILETNRMKNRYKAYMANDVWKKRLGPPPDWNKKLPDWFYEKQKTSVLSSTEES